MGLIEELKRRNVFRVAIAYGFASWLLLQVGDIVLETVAAPDWTMKALLAALLLGFPLAVLFAWVFEMTPEGIKRESEIDRSQSVTPQTARRLDVAIIIVLVLALGYFVVDKFVLRAAGPPSVESASSAAAAPGSSALAGAVPANATGSTEAAAGAAPPENSIAVLPFVNLSSDPEQEFFSDGISEELLNVLAQYPGLRVAARTSSFQFKDQNQDVAEIARLLRVEHVLEGSVRKAGNRLRITAQLIEAQNGYHLWSQTFDRELDDVFAIQDEISAAIGEALRVELALGGPGDLAAPRVAESSNTAAYEAFLKGRALIAKRGRKNIVDAVDELERSVRLDPDYAPSQAWLAIGTALLLNSPSSYGDYTLAEMLQLATPHLDRAMVLDPNLAAAHGANALILGYRGDLPASVAAAKRAVELNPAFVDAMNWGQQASRAMGDLGNSVEQLEKLVATDPLSVVARLNFVAALGRARTAKADRYALELAEQSAWASYVARSLMEWYVRQDLSAALEMMLRAYAESPLDDWSNRNLIFLLSSVGETAEARRISDMSAYLADYYDGNYESMRDELAQRFERDPDNRDLKNRFADAAFMAGDYDRSLGLYLELQDQAYDGLVLSGDNGLVSHARMVWLLAQRQEMDQARNAAALLTDRVQTRRELGVDAEWEPIAEAVMAMAFANEEQALAQLRQSLELGLRDTSFFEEPAFEPLAANPEFLSIRAQVQQELDREHAEMLQLMCFNNPVPNSWQPLEATCRGVTRSLDVAAG